MEGTLYHHKNNIYQTYIYGMYVVCINENGTLSLIILSAQQTHYVRFQFHIIPLVWFCPLWTLKPYRTHMQKAVHSTQHTHTAAASTNQFNVFVDDLFIAFSYTYIKHGICRMVYSSYVWIHSYTFIYDRNTFVIHHTFTFSFWWCEMFWYNNNNNHNNHIFAWVYMFMCTC